MGLGSYPDIGLAEIRRIGMDLRAEIAAGIDPIIRRSAEAEQAVASAVPTFEDAAEEVYASLKDGFRNAKHSAQWITTLRSVVFPHIGQRRVDELRVADFAEVLRPIWLSMSPTASRIQQRCERLMT